MFIFGIIQLLQNLESEHNAFLNPFADYDTRSSACRRLFQKYSFWRAFLKRCVFVDRFQRIRVDGRPNRRKISVFKQKRLLVDGASVVVLRAYAMSPRCPPVTMLSTNERNNSQQHPTTGNRMCKRTQHVTSNNFGSCWPTTLHLFARGFKLKLYFWLGQSDSFSVVYLPWHGELHIILHLGPMTCVLHLPYLVLTTPENIITYHNALCLSPQNFA